jgi:hypothetical protein
MYSCIQQQLKQGVDDHASDFHDVKAKCDTQQNVALIARVCLKDLGKS